MEKQAKQKLTKNERSWILYDCGNSAYSIAITTALLPVYFGMMLGNTDTASTTLGYFNSIASIIVAILAPILGTISDYKNYKKRFFSFFFLLGVVFTGLLAVVPQSQAILLMVFYVLTCVGFAGSNIFYDSFLVDVTSNERMDRVSAGGFAYGYIASVIPFAISLLMILVLGTDKFIGYQLGFVITALWWGFITIPFFKNVRQIHYVEPEENPIGKSFKRLFDTFKEIKKLKIVVLFLVAYFLYIDGVDTIIKMCVPYTVRLLSLTDGLDLYTSLGILLAIQIIAFPCALIYGRLAKSVGIKKMIIFAICTYIVACGFGAIMSKLWHMFVLGVLIGSAQGGIQALSRSYYAKIIPKKNSSEFFGFYNIFGKFAAIIGPALMAFIWTVTDGKISNNTPLGILAIIPLFIIGLLLFLKLPEQKEA